MTQPIVQSQPTYNRLKDCRHGRMLYNFHDAYVGRSLDLYGEYSEEEVWMFRQVLRPGDLVVEAGANLGAHTIPLAQIVGPTGAVVALEPQRLLFQTLCANAALNSLINIFAHQAAAGEALGSVNVPVFDPNHDQNFGKFAVTYRSQGEHTPVLTIDSLPIQSCRLIKADVEGMELQVLHGAEQTIKKFGPALYVENDRKDLAADLIRYIDSLGYDMFWHEPRLFNPDNFFKNPDNVFRKIVSTNMLCVPRGVSQFITGLKKVDVPCAAGLSQHLSDCHRWFRVEAKSRGNALAC